MVGSQTGGASVTALPTADDPMFQQVTRLRGLLAVLEEFAEVPVGGPLERDSDRLSGEFREAEGSQPPTFNEIMAVIQQRGKR